MSVIAGVDLAWQGHRNPTVIAVRRVTDGKVTLTGVHENLHTERVFACTEQSYIYVPQRPCL